MKLVNKQFKYKLLYTLICIEDNSEQERVKKLLDDFESRFNDEPKFIEDIQKALRKNAPYDKFIEKIVDDIMSMNVTESNAAALEDLLNQIKPIVEKDNRNWFEKLIDQIRHAAGKK